MLEMENCSVKILVADDMEEHRVFLCELLEREGYQALGAPDGEKALELMRTQKLDLALLDVMMPRCTGFAVCRSIKFNPETRLIPVVLVTGLSDTEDRIEGIECGADDFISKPVRIEELLARVRSLIKLKQFTDELERAESVLYSLARSIEAKDPYTEGHCERLSMYSVALATRLKLPEEQREALRRGGVVHDIGKIGVPEHILLKPGPLTQKERKLMQQHTIAGERICAPLKSFRLVLPIIRHHHEKLDGSGYPDGLKGNQIPLSARILQTVDIYDALTSDRPYRKALAPSEVFAQMQDEVKQGWWDGNLVNELQALLDKSGAFEVYAAKAASY